MHFPNGIYGKTPLNTSEISPQELNIETKRLANPLPWKGQFSPQLVQVLLKEYAEPDMVVLDPFLGSGTLLLEAGRAKLTAYGTEINPAAITLARTYHFINVSREDRKAYLNKLEKLLNDTFPIVLPIDGSFQNDKAETIKDAIVRLAENIHEPLEKILIEALIALMDFHKPDLLLGKTFRKWNRLTSLVLSLPFSSHGIEAIHSDARNIPLTDSSVNLVITSPPYINVHNYHQQYRASMESLQWNLIEVAKSEIGSNRKFRGNRFLTVVQFCLDIAQTIRELLRVCDSDAQIIFIVGRESNVRKTKIYNGEIVAEIACEAFGCNLILRQERVFTNRFGQNIYEDILHFVPGPRSLNSSCVKKSREIAGEALQSAYTSASSLAKTDIDAALAGLSKVLPSPLFHMPYSRKTREQLNENVLAKVGAFDD